METAVNLYNISFNWLKLVIARLWISLLLFPFPLDYVDLKQYPDWLINLSLRFMVTVADFCVRQSEELHHRVRSRYCNECFEAFFNWSISKIFSSDWSIKCFEAFVMQLNHIHNAGFILDPTCIIWRSDVNPAKGIRIVAVKISVIVWGSAQ